MGMPLVTLCVTLWDAERPGLHSHAERGNDQIKQARKSPALRGFLCSGDCFHFSLRTVATSSALMRMCLPAMSVNS
ncbi:hypothetical protein DJ480_02735 [Pseudomonas sp. Leaf98]|nr:hypothetical protein DJ480_02735 [Pseudomonas sp. Leaf98]